MKLSDYVIAFLKSKGVEVVFYLPGGGCMHLLDSLAGCKELEKVSLLHEQAVAVACEAYSSTTGNMGAALVTTGPGGTNTITGVLAAYLDSTPCFFISGQVKTVDLKSRFGVRSFGSQEADIVSLVTPITKYAAMVTDKNSIRYHLERAWHEALTGRKGPVWLDIPLDIQGSQIDEVALDGFTPPVQTNKVDVSDIIALLNQAVRPVVIAGNGMSGCREPFNRLIEILSFPVIPTWKAMDYIYNDHPLYAGRVGGMGDRPGNLTMQNADLILSLGSRLDFSITGFDRSQWAPRAKKIIVDIDPAEIGKLQIELELPVVADAAEVIAGLLERAKELKLQDLTSWKAKILEWKQRYPLMSIEKYTTNAGLLTTYGFVDVLCKHLPADAYIAPCSSGTTAEIFFQAFTVKQGQVIRSNHGLGSMGFEIPNAIGVCIASGKKDTVCIAGDGGMQLNIQELAVIRGRNLPIKIFVINNGGYASIRNMQNNHFKSRYIGCDEASGLFLPDMRQLSAAYGIQYSRIEKLSDLEFAVKEALCYNGPIVCEVIVDHECVVSPRSATQVFPDGSMRSSPLENQFPFLPEDETKANIL